jgi:glutaconate CoA-transferase, subunit B
VRDATGWDLKVSPELSRTPMPTETELTTLRELKAAT